MIALLFALAAGFNVPPTPDHYVTDTTGVLSDSTHTAIENELQSFEKATGHQIIVYIAQTTGDVPLETWTGETADRWKVGHKGKDDGAVLFVFMQDHKLRIEVGYGLESKLTDADASRIINDEITPKMRSGDVDGAISAGVAGMLAAIDPTYKTSSISAAPAESSPDTGPVVLFYVVAFLFGAFIAFIILAQVIGTIRYGYLILREGPSKAQKDMSKWWWTFGSGGFSSGGGGFSFGGGGGGGFSAGGGGFGGGGASGGW